MINNCVVNSVIRSKQWRRIKQKLQRRHAQAAPAEAEAISLGVNDLQNAAQIIDIAMSKRCI